MANTLNLSGNGAVGFIDWLDGSSCFISRLPHEVLHNRAKQKIGHNDAKRDA